MFKSNSLTVGSLWRYLDDDMSKTKYETDILLQRHALQIIKILNIGSNQWSRIRKDILGVYHPIILE